MVTGGFLERLTNEARAKLLASARPLVLQPGAIIFEADNREWAGVVVQGVVRIFSELTDGRRITHRYVGVGGVIGLGALVGTSDVVAAQAAGAARLLQLNPLVVRRLRERDAEFNLAVAREIHLRLVDTSWHAVLRLRGNLERRLAIELLDLTAESGTGLPIAIPVTHEALAQAVGTSREVVSRHLRLLCARGLVAQRGRGQLVVLDAYRLLAFGEGKVDMRRP